MIIQFTLRLINALALHIFLLLFFMLISVNKLTFYCEVLTNCTMTVRSWAITFKVIIKIIIRKTNRPI